MKTMRSRPVAPSSKALSGIGGLDENTGGGFPRSRTPLLVGGTGSGKTILAMHFLVHGAQYCREPSFFVTFEETAERKRVAAELAEVAAKFKNVQLDAHEAELEVRLKSLQTEPVAKQVKRALLTRGTEGRARELALGRSQMGELDGADATTPGQK